MQLPQHPECLSIFTKDIFFLINFINFTYKNPNLYIVNFLFDLGLLLFKKQYNLQ